MSEIGKLVHIPLSVLTTHSWKEGEEDVCLEEKWKHIPYTCSECGAVVTEYVRWQGDDEVIRSGYVCSNPDPLGYCPEASDFLHSGSSSLKGQQK